MLWGALLGGVSDAYFMPYVGFHGAAMTLVGFLLGLLGSQVVIQGLLPLFFFAAAAYVLDSAAVAALFWLLDLPLPSPFLLSAALGCLFTGLLAAGLEAVAHRLWPEERG